MKSPSILLCFLVILSPFISEVKAIDTIYEAENWVDAGGSFTIICKIPMEDPFALEWTRNNETLNLATATDYSIVDEVMESEAILVSKLTVKDAQSIHSGTYCCNKFSSQGHIILVLSGTQSTSDEDAEKGAEINFVRGQDVLVLNCSLTNTPDKVTWAKDGGNLEMVTNEDGVVHLKNREAVTFNHQASDNVHSLTITKPKVTDIGNYTCSSASSDAAAEVVSEKFSVLMRTIVMKIVSLNNIIDGEELLLTCNVVGNPPTEVQWFKMPEPESKDPKDYWTMMPEKQRILVDDPRIHVNNSVMNTTMTSHLNIKEIELTDRFVYMCLADNTADGVVSSNSTILIRVVGKYAALWPFLGICAEVLILCIVIFIYERRRGNKKLDDESDQNNSKHAVNSKDSEVRHRK